MDIVPYHGELTPQWQRNRKAVRILFSKKVNNRCNKWSIDTESHSIVVYENELHLKFFTSEMKIVYLLSFHSCSIDTEKSQYWCIDTEGCSVKQSHYEVITTVVERVRPLLNCKMYAKMNRKRQSDSNVYLQRIKLERLDSCGCRKRMPAQRVVRGLEEREEGRRLLIGRHRHVTVSRPMTDWVHLPLSTGGLGSSIF